MALIRKVDCVRLFVPHLEAGLAFYRDRLGHELIWRTETAVGLRLPETDAELVLQTEDQRQEVDLLVDSADEAAIWIKTFGRGFHLAQILSSSQSQLLLDHLTGRGHEEPNASQSLTQGITRSSIIRKVVERPAIIGDLCGAICKGDCA
jgi:catechol 2,3-dioxygenase-like lactoylglutathione lyase family enzyme